MLRILGKRQSINVRKVLWTCDEIGVPYAQEEWGAGARPTSESEFRLLNPKGLVPVVVDGDNVLTESNTIVRYLATKHGRADLLPVEPLARASVEEVMDWQATELNWSWRVTFQSIVRKSAHAGTADQVAQSLAEWTRMMRLLEQRLSDARLYTCGTEFTVADIVIGLSINRWFQAPIERPALPCIEAYFRKLIQRPAAATYLGGNTD
jgi:glutathione S-transferase